MSNPTAILCADLHLREDILDLYGFLDKKDLEFFEMLISISGIGPRGAINILSVASVETLKKAVSNEDSTILTKVSGIGQKTAEKIILEFFLLAFKMKTCLILLLTFPMIQGV